MKVTATLNVHRPERVLYYLPENNEEVSNYIRTGACPETLKKYLYAFGTYDEVGVFYLPKALQKETGMKCVVGIEFRKDDPAVELPSELPFVVLPECDIVIHDLSYEYQMTEELMEEAIECVRSNKIVSYDMIQYAEDGLVVGFSTKDKLRLLYEIQLRNKPKSNLTIGSDLFSKDELYFKAYHEAITGYYNWPWMWERLKTYYLDGIKDYGFVHFDVKDFNMINELYNHQVANEVLIRITKNIEAHKDWIYFGARCDNDNFALMIKDMPEQETKQKLEVFFDEISQLEHDPTYRIYYRCGVVTMRTAMNNGQIVADCAKLAQSMGTGINNTEINFYTNEMHEDVLWGKHLKVYLDTAIQANEFLVYLQPKIDIQNECVCGAEALIRWNYKHRELLAPFRFIPYFEADGSIVKIDELVLHRVCAKLKEWKEKGQVLYPISVNLSSKHLEQPRVVSQLTGIVDSYGVNHGLIEFELTESTMAENQKYLLFVMNELRKRGFRISMDDFGTGYSSFALLNEMPLDTLKIDKSFVDMILEENDANKILIILRHIISMAREIGVNCVAEGTEEYKQVLALRELGCEIAQGYYYSKPIPVKEFEEKYLK